MIAMNLLIILSIIYMVRLRKIGKKQRDNDLSGDINIVALEAADEAAFYIYIIKFGSIHGSALLGALLFWQKTTI